MSKVVLVKTATFVKTDGGVFSEFRIWSEIDFFFREIDFFLSVRLISTKKLLNIPQMGIRWKSFAAKCLQKEIRRRAMVN